MVRKKILIMLLIVLLIIFIFLSILIKKLTINTKEEPSFYKIITDENKIWENTTSYAQDEDFETIGIPNEILKRIKSKKKFDLAIKNYINRYEFLGASKAELEDYEIDKNNNSIIMNFKLDNIYEDLFCVILYLQDNSMEIVDIWSEEDWNDEESSDIDWSDEDQDY